MKMKSSWGIVVNFTGLAVLFSCALLLAFLGVNGAHPLTGQAGAFVAQPSSASHSSSVDNRRWVEAYGKLPLSFVENQGQTAREVRYIAQGPGYELFLTPQEAVLALRSGKHLDLSPKNRAISFREYRKTRLAGTLTAIRMRLEGANPKPVIQGFDRLPTRVNYFIGSDPKNWHTNVGSYSQVKYSDIYPGIDLVFYGNQRRLEYDFVVAPGADPSQISMGITGAGKVQVNSRGDVVMQTADGNVELHKPLIYQRIRGERREIAGNYTIDRLGRLRFTISRYDRREPLILDPVLDYSTYLGGTATEDDYPAAAIAVDSSGDAFVVGQTTSTDFPTGTNGAVVPAPTTNLGAPYVAELNPTGTQLLYSTYLEGSTTFGGDSALGVAVDSTGKVYVTGVTFAAGFPLQSALPSIAGNNSANTAGGTCFVSKLDPASSGTTSLLFSSYLGGTGGEVCNAIAADSGGNAYITGYTLSTDFPTQNPAQSSNLNTSGTAFLSRINTTTSTLVYSTYLGGDGANVVNGGLGVGDIGYGVAVDSANVAYLAGGTASSNFPTAGKAFQPTHLAGSTLDAVFVSKIDTTLSGAASLIYSTYLAGTLSASTAEDFATAVGLGPNNVIYVTGQTFSSNFPTAGADLPSGTGATGMAFISLVDPSQSTAAATLKYSTYLGGTGGDEGDSIKADSSGNAYIAGSTQSADFPVTPGALQVTRIGVAGNAFVTKINPSGTDQPANPQPANPILVYSTYIGGSNGSRPDAAYGLDLDTATPPNVYITGETLASDFPVVAAFQSKLNGNGNPTTVNSDAFVAKLSLIPTLVVAPSSFNFGTVAVGVASSPQAFTVTNNTASGVSFTSITITGGSPAAANTDFAISSDGCFPSVTAGAPPCAVSVKFTPSVVGTESATLVINATVTNGGQASAEVFNVNLTGTGAATAPAVTLAPTSLTFGNQQVGTTSAAQTVTLTNTGSAALTINSIAASGDFAATSTGASACPLSPATLAAGANCTISVTFTPTAAGPRAGTLSVTDNASGSPHTASLSGTGTAPAPAVSLDHANVAFTGQMVTTTSAATTVNLKNTGTGALTINASGISTTGDFSQTNNCPVSPQTLAAGLSCAIKVSFAPTATGARNGTLAIADNAAGSPQSIPLTGTGWDFTLTGPTTTQIATPSAPAKFNVTMTPLGGFNQFVAITCTATPPMTTCSAVSPVSAADGTTPQQSQVTLSTSAMTVPPTLIPNLPLSLRQVVPLLLLLALLFLLPRTKRISVRLGIVALMFAALTVAACGGNSTTMGTITVTGQSTGSAGTISHTATVQLITH